MPGELTDEQIEAMVEAHHRVMTDAFAADVFVRRQDAMRAAWQAGPGKALMEALEALIRRSEGRIDYRHTNDAKAVLVQFQQEQKS